MNIRTPVKFIILSCLLLGLLNHTYAQSSSSDKKTENWIRDFYTKYITIVANDEPRPSEKRLDSLRKAYCSASFIKKCPQITEETDSDPVLKAQDSDMRFLKTLTIKRNPQKVNQYIVYYGDKSFRVTIHLIIVQQNGSYKIDSIW